MLIATIVLAAIKGFYYTAIVYSLGLIVLLIDSLIAEMKGKYQNTSIIYIIMIIFPIIGAVLEESI
jgi:hypothetical protein